MAVLAIVLGGCALFRGFKFERPSLLLEAIRIEALDLTGGRLTLVLDVYNPNTYDLRGRGLQAALQLDGTKFGEATLERNFVLPSNAHARVDVPMSFTWEGVGAGARAMLTRGAVDYDLTTLIRADTPAGERPVRVRVDGTVRLGTSPR